MQKVKLPTEYDIFRPPILLEVNVTIKQIIMPEKGQDRWLRWMLHDRESSEQFALFLLLLMLADVQAQ